MKRLRDLLKVSQLESERTDLNLDIQSLVMPYV